MRVFKEVKSLEPKLNPASIMLDFEKAIHNACNINFPETTLVGCLFHLGQNLWRKVQEFHLATAYRSDEDLRMRVKMILALSFVPVQDVPEAFEDLVDGCTENLTPLINYWEDTYIGRQRRGRRSNPRFNLQLWNVRDRVIE